MIAKVFGWGSGTWTAVGTIVLSAVTSVYVGLVGAGNKRLRKSAEAAARSAQATEALVELQRATVPVEFDVSKKSSHLVLQNRGSRVWVHGVAVTNASGVISPSEPWHPNRHIECQPDGLMDTSIPGELEPGGRAWFIWPFPSAVMHVFDAELRIQYGFGPASQRSVKHLSVTFDYE